jgi:hydrogenase-4 component H
VLRLYQRSLRGGVVTGAYPDAPEAAPPAYRGQVLLRTDRCTGDGACARVCPSEAISVVGIDDGWTWELSDARCVFCGLCQDACPTQAIELSNEFELSVRDANDLNTRVRFTRETRAGS